MRALSNLFSRTALNAMAENTTLHNRLLAGVVLIFGGVVLSSVAKGPQVRIENVNPREAYCTVVVSPEGFLTRAVIINTKTGAPIDWVGRANNHSLSNIVNRYSQITGKTASGKQVHVTRNGCAVQTKDGLTINVYTSNLAP